MGRCLDHSGRLDLDKVETLEETTDRTQRPASVLQPFRQRPALRLQARFFL